MSVKILLDTDIGSDPDDAFALDLLLRYTAYHPDLAELVGVTTVSGEPCERARLVSAIVHHFNRVNRGAPIAPARFPILPGAEDPLEGPQRQPCAPQARVLADGSWPHDPSFPHGEAVQFMQDMIRRYPNQVHLLAIGPLTNVAQLFEADPAIPGLLAGLTIMGGRFEQLGDWGGWNPRHVEHNFRCDPRAATMVHEAAVGRHRVVTSNVTERVALRRGEIDVRLRQHASLALVRELASIWFQDPRHRRKGVVFHDPLAAMTLFDPDVCTFERGRIDVVPFSTYRTGRANRSSGRSDWTPGPHGPHERTTAVDRERFFAQLWARPI